MTLPRALAGTTRMQTRSTLPLDRSQCVAKRTVDLVVSTFLLIFTFTSHAFGCDRNLVR